jgi:hypothetical protein
VSGTVTVTVTVRRHGVGHRDPHQRSALILLADPPGSCGAQLFVKQVMSPGTRPQGQRRDGRPGRPEPAGQPVSAAYPITGSAESRLALECGDDQKDLFSSWQRCSLDKNCQVRIGIGEEYSNMTDDPGCRPRGFGPEPQPGRRTGKGCGVVASHRSEVPVPDSSFVQIGDPGLGDPIPLMESSEIKLFRACISLDEINTVRLVCGE